MSKIDIDFVCYRYKWTEGVGTMFLFYLDGEWDEDKLCIDEALANYPVDKYNWIHIAEED